MKPVFLIALSVLVLAYFANQSEARSSREVKQRYSKFKQRFGKKDESKEMEEARLKYFEKTLDLIDAHNEQYINKESSYTVDLNQYSDLFDDEKKKQMTGALIGQSSFLKKRAITSKDLYREWFVADKNVTIKNSNDYRRFFNTTIESQGSCGSCWAFATAVAVNAAYKIHKNKTVNLSKQQLVDCNVNNFGCNGGYIDRAMDYTINNGLVTDSLYKYRTKQYTCNSTVTNSSSVEKQKVRRYAIVRGTEEDLRQALDNYGPCVVILDSNDFYFYNYKSGIFDGKNNGTAVCGNGLYDTNHAVVAVGYGSEKGQDYWIIRNSWGTHWGQNGYMYLRRNANHTCGIGRGAWCPIL